MQLRTKSAGTQQRAGSVAHSPSSSTTAWIADVTQLAVDDGDAAALRLLGELPNVVLAPDQSQRLGERLVAIVRTGGDETWLEGLAPYVASKEVERTLEELRHSPDGDVARRAWWAVRAIGLRRGSSS